MQATERTIRSLPWSGAVTSSGAAGSTDADAAAIERFLAGDERAFDELFDRYVDYVYHVAYGVLGDSELAADVTQEVFVLVYRALRRFRRGAKFATWLYRIAVNRAVDADRARRRRRTVPLSPTLDRRGDSAADPASHDDERSLSDMVAEVMQQLPTQYRDALSLHYFAGLDMEEMATVLGCSVPAVKVRLHRARRKFKELYEKLYPEEAHA